MWLPTLRWPNPPVFRVTRYYFLLPLAIRGEQFPTRPFRANFPMGDYTLETNGSFSVLRFFRGCLGKRGAHYHHLGSVNAKQTFCLTRRAIFGANTSRSTSPWKI